jgi:hypothetical protein
MFCDLVGSTALSSRLNPEDLREFIAAYHPAHRRRDSRRQLPREARTDAIEGLWRQYVSRWVT